MTDLKVATTDMFANADAPLKAALGSALPLASVEEVIAATYTVVTADEGKLKRINVAACAITLPATMPEGFATSFLMYASGQMTLAAGSGAVMHNINGYTKSAGQWATVTAYVAKNNGGLTAAEWVIDGGLGS